MHSFKDYVLGFCPFKNNSKKLGSSGIRFVQRQFIYIFMGFTTKSTLSSILSMEHLVFSGVHLGHASNCWDVTNSSVLYGTRNGRHLIDLNHT